MSAGLARPNLDGVLAATAPGRVVRLRLTPEQRRELRDPDGQLGLRILRALVAARRASVKPSTAPPEFPMTPGAMQAIAARLGEGRIGIKRCARARRRLLEKGVVEDAGSHRQAYRHRSGADGYRVPLLRLAVQVVGYVRASTSSAPRYEASVRRRRRVKRRTLRVRWWQTVFAGPDRRPPPGIMKRAAARMCSIDELNPVRE
jgi:hypothetical protein